MNRARNANQNPVAEDESGSTIPPADDRPGIRHLVAGMARDIMQTACPVEVAVHAAEREQLAWVAEDNPAIQHGVQTADEASKIPLFEALALFCATLATMLYIGIRKIATFLPPRST